METQTELKIGRGISYNPFKIEDKHYFGSFFNLANNNLIDVFHEFKIRLNDKKGENHFLDIFNRHFNSEMSIVDYEKYIGILRDYFPIISSLDKKEELNKTIRINYFIDHFTDLIEAIESMRHFYTHFHHDPIILRNKERLFQFLDDCIFKTALDAKNKYLKTDKTKEALSLSLKDELKNLYDRKIKELEAKKKENPKFKFSREITEITSSLYNEAFRDFIYKDNKGQNQLAEFSSTKANDRDFVAKTKEFESDFSTRGIVFLLSMFLSRKEAEDLKANISGFKGKVVKNQEVYYNSLKYMATHRVFSRLCFKGLKHSVKTSEFDKETLLMQMIDELSKVPDCIYEGLNELKKKEFLEDWNEYYKDNDENDENLENSKVAHPVIRKRFEDKFNYFALRYLDEFGNFPSLRFQIKVGNFVHDTTTKKIGGTNLITDRVVKESLNVFGKLSEIGKLKKEYFVEIENSELGTQFELFPNPFYNFLKQADASLTNNIPIYFEVKNTKLLEDIANEKKELFSDQNRKLRTAKKQTKSDLLNELLRKSSSFIQAEPTAILSLNEIPALLYEVLVKNTDGVKIERKIEKKLVERFYAIKNKDLSKKEFLPKSIFKNLGESVNISKLSKDLMLELEITEQKLKILTEFKGSAASYVKESAKYQRTPRKDKPKTLRKYVFYSSEKGEIATWVANDIKRFMPKSFKQTWRSIHHNELQRAIAYYDSSNKHILNELLKSCEFDITTFDIKQCFNKNNFEDFYESYLTNRKECFHGISKGIESFKDNSKVLKIVCKSCFVFMKEQNYKKVNQNKLINRILAMPAQLARGIFDDKATQKPSTPLQGNEDQFADWFVAAKQNRDLQKFYDEKLYPRPLDRKKEALVTKQKINDFYVKLMAEDILNNIFKAKEEISLTEIFQTRKERLALQAIADQQKDKPSGDTSENIRNQTYFWNKLTTLHFYDGKMTIENVKLKNIGKFKKLESDQRIKTFLSYEDDITWLPFLQHNWKNSTEAKPLNVIQIQIDEYEKIRSQEILKSIQNLENYIYENVRDKAILKNGNDQNFKSYVLNGLYGEIKNIDVSEFKILRGEKAFDSLDFTDLSICDLLEKQAILIIAIRNKFAHNQFPNREMFQLANEFSRKKEDETYAAYYARILNLLIESLMK